MNKDSLHSFGFIYIDPEAGLTFDLAGTFHIDQDGKFIPKKNDSISIKHRLEPNETLVALIPETKFGELQIPAVPVWLQYYKTDTTAIVTFYRRGYLYNAWNEYEMALTYLEKGEKKDPAFKGLSFELGYAYNALGKFEKAIAVLESAVKRNPADCYLYKELSYAQIHMGQLDKAAATCAKGISLCEDKDMKAEIALNLAQQFYKQKDQQQFKHWADETKKWAADGDKYTTIILAMEKNLTQ